jgi:hypothetical protein
LEVLVIVMPFVRTDELVSARELMEIIKSWDQTDAPFGVVTTDYGEYRYDKHASVGWKEGSGDNGGRWRFWKWVD